MRCTLLIESNTLTIILILSKISVMGVLFFYECQHITESSSKVTM